MQIGQQSASIAAYNNHASAHLNEPAQQAAQTSKVSLANDTNTTTTSPQESSIVTLSSQALALAEQDATLEIGNGTGKPPLDP